MSKLVFIFGEVYLKIQTLLHCYMKTVEGKDKRVASAIPRPHLHKF
jgi:hypothetical protein